MASAQPGALPGLAGAAPVQAGKRNGHVQPEKFGGETYMSQLDTLAQRLNEQGAGTKFDKKALVQLFSGLAQFMEDALGVKALYKPFTRLPASLLHDASPDGPLALIAAACGEHMKAKGLKRIDWLAPNLRKEYMELFGRIRAELLRSGYVRTPVVYVHPACGAAAPKLQEAVRALKGEVSQGESGATHVVHPAGEGPDPFDDSQPLARTLEVKGGSARVHWLYLPDSYDEWVPAAAAPAAAPARRAPRGPWHVYARWLTDSEKFNEWMSPADYETPEGVAAEADKRRREGEEEGGRKPKAARQAGPLAEVQLGAGEVVAEGVVRQQVLQPNRKMLEAASAVDISQGQRAEGVVMPEPAVQPTPELAARARQLAGGGGAQPPQAQQQAGGADEEPYLVPACASWFRWDGIAEVEEAHFRDFMASDPLNAERYREYRNAIIDKYREDVHRELSFTEARRCLVGDVNLLRRIWRFLASWQLINFMARRRERPAGEPALGGAGAKGLPASGLEALYAPSRRATVGEGAGAALSAGAVRLRTNAFGAWGRQPQLATKADFYCRGAECGQLCSELRHHCLKRPDLDLCPKCFKEGKWPAGLCARDFVRLEAADAAPDDSGWTDQETLLLLEGIEKYGEGWQQVAEHVGGRTAMQCVARFLQLPGQDALLADDAPGPQTQGLVAIPPRGSAAAAGGMTAAAGVLQDVLPFSDTANPVLAQVSFLAAMVGPKIAAAAASRALEVLAEEDAAAAAAVAGELAAEGGDAAMPDANASGAAGGGPVSAARMRLAAATGLAAASVQAKLLADTEEREAQRLVLAAIEQQFKKVHAKLQYLEQLDGVLAQERLGLEEMRGRFIDEYAQVVADNVAAGIGPPPGRMVPAQAQQPSGGAP